MDRVVAAIREHPLGFALFLGVALFMAVRLRGMLRTLWGVSRTPRDRRAAVAMTAILAVAFCLLWGFLFVSIFA